MRCLYRVHCLRVMAAFGLACLLSACTTVPPTGTAGGTPRIVERDLSGSAKP